MLFLSRYLLLVGVLFPPPSHAQDADWRVSLERCRNVYATWETEVAAAKALSLVDLVSGATRLNSLQRKAGDCLLALQNDLEAVEETDAWWKPTEATHDGVPTTAKTVQQRVLEVEKNLLQGATPEWNKKPSLGGWAIGSSVDYKRPREYLEDAGAVSKKWSELAPKFAPVLEGLVSRMKPHVGLAVDTRDCRALWLLESADTNEAQRMELPAGSRIGFCLQALMNDLDTLERHLRTLTTQPKNITVTDIKDWREPTLHGAAIGSVQSVEIDIDKYLIDSHLVHKSNMETWRTAENEAAPGLGDTVHSVMSFRGLRELVSLLFTAEMALLDMRSDGDRSVFASQDTKAKPFPTATLLLESDHFGAERSPWAHFSFGGQLSALPAINLLNRQPTDSTPPDNGGQLPASGEINSGDAIYPTFQQAFVWDLNARVHSRLSDRLEVSGVGFLGQSVLLDDKSLIERDEDFVGVPLDNETGRAEIFKGWLVEARTFDLGLDIIHGEHSYLNPRFSIAYGERWNDRLVPEVGSPIPKDKWMKSRLFRFRWNIRNTLASRDKFQKPLLVTFSFGVEREWWPDNTGLPTITALYFSGDFDLTKIIKKGE